VKFGVPDGRDDPGVLDAQHVEDPVEVHVRVDVEAFDRGHRRRRLHQGLEIGR